MLRHMLAASTAMAIALSFGGAAYAQELEEIVVTARKVEESLMEVPLAISAMSANDLASMNIQQINDISRMTPSFQFTNQSGGSGRNDRSSNALTFRGLFLNNNSGASAGGQLFIDGAPVIGAQAPSPQDIQRVEVLKGPQSAYFGRSTFMGAINFVTRDPSQEFQGRVTAEYASFDSHEESLSVEGGSDKMAGRISLRNFTRGGQYANPLNPGEKLGAQNTKSISGTFVARPLEGLKAKLFINYFEDSDGMPAQTVLAGSNVPVPSLFNCSFPGARQGAYYCGRLPDAGQIPRRLISADSQYTPELQNAINTAPGPWKIFDPAFLDHFGLERRAFQTDLRLDYDFAGGWNLSSLTAYHWNKQANLIDSTYTGEGDRPNPQYNPAIANSPRNFTYMRMLQSIDKDYSQELRLTSPQDKRLRGTAGVNYLRYWSPGGTVYGVDILGGPRMAASVNRSRRITPAVFGGLYFDVINNVTVSAEARYQWDKIKTIPYVNAQGNVVTGPASNVLAGTFKSFSPRVSLDWNFAPDSTAYVLFSRGYRPGGFNTILVTATPDVLAAVRAVEPNAGPQFEEEQLDNYEAGVKMTFWQRRARAALTVYYDEYLNGQVGASIPVRTATVTNLLGVTINSGTAKLWGFEFQGDLALTENLKISAAAALNNTKVGTANPALYNCTDCQNILGNAKAGLGNRLPTTPKWTWVLSADYSNDINDTWDWFTRIDYSHKGLTYVDFTNVAWTGNVDNINFRLGLRTEKFTVEGFVTNLTNDKDFISAGTGVDVYSFAVPPSLNGIRVSLPVPRMFGVRASYNF